MTPTSLYSFQIAVSQVGGGNAAPMHLCLSSAWANPARSYHTTQHLTECLALAHEWGEGLSPIERATLTLAVWFHDAVYDPRSSDNEKQSAQLALKALRHSGVAEHHYLRVSELVLATEHAMAVPVGDRVRDLLLDIDLAILGAAPSRFAEHQAQVRKEYAFVSEADYAAGRAQVLEHFRAQASAAPQQLYRTPMGRQRAAQALANLTGALA